MIKNKNRLHLQPTVVLTVCLSVLLSGCGSSEESTVSTSVSTTKAALGESLFNDPNLSLTRSQSCATCHNPQHAFMDDRANGVSGAASLGDDGIALGDRNSPMLTYALFSPAFSNDGAFIGGQFWDGRASDLVAQAKGPFLNALEMQMPSESAVVDRILENSAYVTQMKEVYGEMSLMTRLMLLMRLLMP